MARTISSTNDGPFVLSLADPLASFGSDDPLTITATGMIASTGAGIDGIDGAAGTVWIITNDGTVSSSGGWGISLAGAGVLDNSGLISGGASGGFNSGGFGLVTNNGTINGGGGFGVKIGGFGVVTNGDDGSITSVEIGGSGVVTNQGSMTDPTHDIGIGGFGLVTNQGSLNGGIEIGGFGLVTNQGTVRGGAFRGSVGVQIGGGGVVTNESDASILASTPGFGIEITGGFGVVTNDGSISAGIGVNLAGGGVATNNGSINGGIEIGGGPGAVTNKGSIIGGDGFDTGVGFGVELTGGGVVTNKGAISGNDLPFVDPANAFGVEITGGSGTVTNQGAISGFGSGVELAGGGAVTNRAGASITGGLFGGKAIGVEISGGSGTVTNAGLISGGIDSVVFGPGTTNDRLIIDPGAVFDGLSDASGATFSTMELAKGTGAISGIPTELFKGFNSLVIDSGAEWSINGAIFFGTNTIDTVLNDGSLAVSGSMHVSTAIDPHGTGIFQLVGPATLEVAAALGTSSKISFTAGSKLVVDDFALFGQHVGTKHYAGSLLESFDGSTIDLKDFGTAGLSMSFSAATGLLQLTNAASQLATLDFQNSSLGGGTFHTNTDGSGGVLITHS